MPIRLRRLLLALPLASVVGLGLPSAGVSAQASTYVPVEDPAYEDLETLLSQGLVPAVLAGERPWSEAAFARAVEAARTAGEGGTTARVREALQRLSDRFAPVAADTPPEVRLRPVRAGLAGARSPFRELSPGADGDLDATFNPLLQGNQGRVLADGVTAALEPGVGWGNARIGAAFSPRVYLASPRGEGDTEAELDVREAYVRGILDPFSLEVGRFGMAWGFGTEGGGLLSGNARPLDMIRVANDRPVRLPGFLSGLGLWQGSFALARFDEDRDVPRAKAALAHVGWRPSRYVELSFNYLNMQGGEGGPEATLEERIRDFFFLLTESDEDNPSGLFLISDKVAGADLRISVPEIGSALYVNFFTTDDRAVFTQPAKGYTQDAFWLVGAETRGLGPEGRLDLRAEFRDAGARIYAHGQYTSGMTVDGRVLGDPMGPNATGLLGQVGWTAPNFRLRLTASSEEYYGDRWRWQGVRDEDNNVSSLPWERIEDNPDELRRRVLLDYLRFPGARGIELSARLGVEQVTRFDFTEEDRTNLLAQAVLRYHW